jgi:hypothetical protein
VTISHCHTDFEARKHLHVMAAKALDTKTGMSEHREKRVSSVGQLFGDDLKSSRAIKGLISACTLTACMAET